MTLLTRCIRWLLSKLHKQGIELHHPEEPVDNSQNMDNVSVPTVINRWLSDWHVPRQYWDYWRLQDVKVTMEIPSPAASYADAYGARHILIRPEWLNPGTLAHEEAHNSYALLTERQKKDFASLYELLKGSDPLVKQVCKEHPYALQDVVEGHAEVYRFLGQQMPAELRPYYPKLLIYISK